MKKIFKMMALVAFMVSAGIVSAADSDKAAAKSSTMKVPKPASSVGGAGYAEAVITTPVPSDTSINPNGLTSNQSAGSFCGLARKLSYSTDRTIQGNTFHAPVLYYQIASCGGQRIIGNSLPAWNDTHRFASQTEWYWLEDYDMTGYNRGSKIIGSLDEIAPGMSSSYTETQRIGGFVNGYMNGELFSTTMSCPSGFLVQSMVSQVTQSKLIDYNESFVQTGGSSVTDFTCLKI